MALDLAQYYQVLDPNGPGVGDFLDQLHKYDPNASYVATPQITGEGGTTNGTMYQLSFNPSKLPGLDGTGSLSPATSSLNGQYGGGPNFVDVNGPHDPLLDPSKVQHTSAYGDITPRGNVSVPETHSWLDYAPLLVGAFGAAFGGIPAVFGSGLLGDSAGAAAGDLSGLGASDPFLQGGTGAMDMTGSYGTGLPGSLGAAQGGAESSLYGAGALDNPAGALGGSGAAPGGMTQADWDKIIAGQPENGSFVGPNGTDPNGFTPGDYTDLNKFNAGLDNPSLTDRLSNLLKDPASLAKIPGLLGAGAGTGTGSGGGGGGGNLLVNAGQQQRPQVEDAAAILARLYGPQRGLLGAR